MTASCPGKPGYPTQAAANAARAGLAEKPAAGFKKRRRAAKAAAVQAYRCEGCGNWHLGRERTRIGPRRPATGPNSLVALAARYYAVARESPE